MVAANCCREKVVSMEHQLHVAQVSQPVSDVTFSVSICPALEKGWTGYEQCMSRITVCFHQEC